MAAIVTKATFSPTNSFPLIGKDDGKTESQGRFVKTQHSTCVHLKDARWQNARTWHAHMILVSGRISDSRFTERQKCIDAGGQTVFPPHGCLHSTHSQMLGSSGKHRENEWEQRGRGIEKYRRGVEKGKEGKALEAELNQTFNHHFPSTWAFSILSYPTTHTCDVTKLRQSVMSFSFNETWKERGRGQSFT